MHLTENDPLVMFPAFRDKGIMVPAMQHTQDPQQEALLIESEDYTAAPADGTRYKIFWQVLVEGDWQDRSDIIANVDERDHFVGLLQELTAGGYARNVAVAE